MTIKSTALAIILLVLATGWAAPGFAEAQEREVSLTVFLIDVDGVDSVTQSFVANVYADLRWNDPSLAHPGPDSLDVDLDDIWHPRVQILNEQRVVRTFPGRAEVRPNGDVIARQRYWGGFSQPLELRQFPFDRQDLRLTFVNTAFGSISVRLTANQDSLVSESLRVPDWRVLGWDFEAVDLPIGPAGAPPLPAAVFTLHVERYLDYFTLKIILPLMLIVAMSWLVFWIAPDLTATKISVAITSMLTLIAYRFAIGAMVPPLAFLTSLDYFVLGSTVLVFLTLLEVVVIARLTQKGHAGQAAAVDAVARWLAPILYLLVVLESLVFRFWNQAMP